MSDEYDIDAMKRMIRRNRQLENFAQAFKKAQEEIEAEEEAGAISDEMTEDEAIRRMLEGGCRLVRERGEYPSKERVRKVLNNMPMTTFKRLWVRVRRPGEEWPPETGPVAPALDP